MARRRTKRYENPVGSCDVGEYRDALPSVLPSAAKGRGSRLNPGNRHETRRLFVLGEHWDHLSGKPSLCPSHGTSNQAGRVEPLDDRGTVTGGETEVGEGAIAVDRERAGGIAEEEGAGDGQGEERGEGGGVTRVLPDDSRSILNHVESPDIPYAWTVNPYRGCEHGCVYCYARPDHERLGFSCGLDFETRIMAKFDAPRLLERELAHPKWTAQPITFCGVTDCYQPIEAKYRLTRGCLEVLARCRQPVVIITKNKLVTRDIDLLSQLSRFHAVQVAISITTLDNHLASVMEPRASSPRDRLSAISMLSQAGIAVTVMTAPIIPAINDHEMPAILQAAANAGATSAGYVLLRLPYQLKDLYEDWLFRHFPDRAERALNLLRQTRGGELYDAAFGQRMTGTGPLARQLKQMFLIFARRYGLTRRRVLLSGRSFVAPPLPPSLPPSSPSLPPDGQMSLFDRHVLGGDPPAKLF